MSAGKLAGVNTLIVKSEYTDYGRNQDYDEALALAFQRMEKLEHLELQTNNLRQVMKIVTDGLGVTVVSWHL
jgi:hypothetical protein